MTHFVHKEVVFLLFEQFIWRLIEKKKKQML